MHKVLQKYCNSKNYRKLFQIIESKTVKPNQTYKHVDVDHQEIMEIKEFTYKSIMEHIHNNKNVPIHLFNIVKIFDKEYENHIKTATSNYLITKEIANISEFIVQKFIDPSNLKEIYNYVEEKMEEFNNNHDDLPNDWSLDLKILCRSLVIIKKILCEYFFTKKIDKLTFSQGFIATINFEDKSSNFFDKKKCCTGLEDDENNIQVYGDPNLNKCAHKNLISNVFIPNINVFFEHSLNAKNNLNTENVLNNIYCDFIDFFKRLENVYQKMQNFNDNNIFVVLFQSADKILNKKINLLDPKEYINSLICDISTLIYVQETFDEFIYQISEAHEIEDMVSMSLITLRKLEEKISQKVNLYFTTNLIIASEEIKIVECFKKIYEKNTKISNEVINFIVEIGMSILFRKITKLKMNKKFSKLIFSDITHLEQYLKGQGINDLSYYKIILNYLEVYMNIDESKDSFYKNYIKIKDKFSLNYLLKALEDQDHAKKLYEEYEN